MDNPSPQMPALTLNAPNAITAIRIVLSALIAWLLIQGMPAQVLLAGILLVLAWATYGLDGFLARKLGQSSLAGGLFDLVADRVLMTPALIMAIAVA